MVLSLRSILKGPWTLDPRPRWESILRIFLEQMETNRPRLAEDAAFMGLDLVDLVIALDRVPAEKKLELFDRANPHLPRIVEKAAPYDVAVGVLRMIADPGDAS